MHDLEQLHTIPGFVARYRPTITESAIRWQIRNRQANGLEAAHAITKRSGRWLIHEGRYAAWLMGAQASRAA